MAPARRGGSAAGRAVELEAGRGGGVAGVVGLISDGGRASRREGAVVAGVGRGHRAAGRRVGGAPAGDDRLSGGQGEGQGPAVDGGGAGVGDGDGVGQAGGPRADRVADPAGAGAAGAGRRRRGGCGRRRRGRCGGRRRGGRGGGLAAAGRGHDGVDDALLGHRGGAAVEQPEPVLAVVAVVPVGGGRSVFLGGGHQGVREVRPIRVVGRVEGRLVDRAVLTDEHRISAYDEGVVHLLQRGVHVVFLSPGRLLCRIGRGRSPLRDVAVLLAREVPGVVVVDGDHDPLLATGDGGGPILVGGQHEAVVARGVLDVGVPARDEQPPRSVGAAGPADGVHEDLVVSVDVRVAR